MTLSIGGTEGSTSTGALQMQNENNPIKKHFPATQALPPMQGPSGPSWASFAAAWSRFRQSGHVDRGRAHADWRQCLRTQIVGRGIQLMCGRADYVSTDAAADIPLVSAGIRLGWLKVLDAVGVKSFVTTSGLGYDFVCHTGDLANFPFYHRAAYRTELTLCSAWLQAEGSPVAFDVGANGGFFATHLAQMLAGRGAKIFAFEPVPSTFKKLVESVERLRLNDSVHPIAAAVLDNSRPALVSYSEQNSLASQIRPQPLPAGAGHQIARVEAVTLDRISDKLGTFPKLVKIDVEGSEAAVLRGARALLARADRPAILFEYNPMTLAECGVSAASLLDLLAGYALYYVDDLRGQKIPFGTPLEKPEKIDWICNLFAVPRSESAFRRWEYILNNFNTFSAT